MFSAKAGNHAMRAWTEKKAELKNGQKRGQKKGNRKKGQKKKGNFQFFFQVPDYEQIVQNGIEKLERQVSYFSYSPCLALPYLRP